MTKSVAYVCSYHPRYTPDLGPVDKRHVASEPLRMRFVIKEAGVFAAHRYSFGIGAYKLVAALGSKTIAEHAAEFDALHQCERQSK